MGKRRSSSSSDGLINVLFSGIYLAYWWIIFHQILVGNTMWIYISIVPFLVLAGLHSLVLTLLEKKRERQLELSVERSIARFEGRIRT